jgi:hypothetical protein
MAILRLNVGTLAHLHIGNEVNYCMKTFSLNKSPNMSANTVVDTSVTICKILDVISQCCSSLKTLSLRIDYESRPIELLSPKSFPRNLSSLSLDCNDHLASECLLIEILENVKNLQMLNLGSFSKNVRFDDILRAIGRNSIRFLSFQQCKNLRKTGMKGLLDAVYPFVEDLNISNPYYVEELCTNEFFEVLSDPEKKCSKLKVFKASQTPSCNVSKLATHYGIFNTQLLSLMPNVEVLDLSSNRHQSDFISVIVESCPLLKRLHISGCELTVKQLIPLQKLAHLAHLDLSFSLNTFYRNWLNVVDRVLVRIPNLKYIDLRGTTIDDKAIFKLMANHCRLEIIDISDVLTVTGILLDLIENFHRDRSITVIDRPARSSKSALQRSDMKMPEWFKLNPKDAFSFEIEGYWDKSLMLSS